MYKKVGTRKLKVSLSVLAGNTAKIETSEVNTGRYMANGVHHMFMGRPQKKSGKLSTFGG